MVQEGKTLEQTNGSFSDTSTKLAESNVFSLKK